jgi:tripartite-type tricarboxylate transporter receptor subunit TctC
MRSWLRLIAPALLVCGLSGAAHAQTAANFPNRPIRIVLPYGPGGITDIVARLLSEPLREALGQPVIVESKPGGSGIVAIQEVSRAKPDGHTLLIGVNTTNLLNPIIRSDEMPFDVRKVLTPVSLLLEAQQVFLATKVNFAPNSVKEFIDYARAHPGELNQAIIGTGSNSHFDFLVMQRKYGFSLVTVPSRSGAASAQVDLLNGATHVAMLNAATYTPLVVAGKLKAFAVTGEARTAELPNVPTLKELGYTDFGTSTWSGLFAPAGTPKDVVDKVHAAFVAAINNPKTQELMAKYTLVSIASKSPEEFSAWLDGQFAYWTPVADQFREELGMPAKK